MPPLGECGCRDGHPWLLCNSQHKSAGEGGKTGVTQQLQEGKRERGCVWLCRYPGRKDENWWLVVGDSKANTLLAIKRVALQRKARVKLDFVAPSAQGNHHLTLYFMCDSYMGCDQVRDCSLFASSKHLPIGARFL